MKYLFFSIAIVLVFTKVYSQGKKPIYFTKQGIETSKKEEAKYYRLIVAVRDSVGNKQYLIKDHFLTGNVQMIGTFKSYNPEIAHGKVVTYYENGNIELESNYVDGKLNGETLYYYPSGKIKGTTNYSNNEIVGITKRWYENDTLERAIKYQNGKVHGNLYCFYENGNVSRLENYHEGKLTQGRCFTRDGRDTTYFPFYINPSYPDGEKAFIDFFSKTLILPRYCPYNTPIIEMQVMMEIDVDGSFSNLKVIKSDNNCYNEEVLLAISKSPPWIPGKINGKPEPLKVYFPVRFSVWK